MKKRLVYVLRWHKPDNTWHLFHAGSSEGWWAPKSYAESAARIMVRLRHERDGTPCQLLIYNKDGKIGRGGRSEASYGCDSPRRKG